MSRKTRYRRNRHGVEIAGPVSTLTDNVTQDDARVEDAASELDRIWFEVNPGETRRTRDPLPGEMRWAIPPGHDLVRVDVYQLAPGLRVRHCIFAPIEGARH